MPSISIIIPTYTNATGKHSVRGCLKSIVEHTNLFGVEILVVANGAPEASRTLDHDFPCRLLWFDEPLGFTRAANEGLKAATGDFLLLLNDDTVILGPNWLDILMEPFSNAERFGMGANHVGITGPMMEWDPNSNAKFLIFFCVVIRRQVLDEIGLLDEAFSPGFGEDTDYCLRAQAAGWEILQVPNENHHTAEREDWRELPSHKRFFWVADFPIFHAGEETFENWEGGDELLAKNRKLLFERWNGKVPRVEKAIATDGWMAPAELRWLATNAKGKKVVVGVGCAHGRSCRAICDHLDDDAVYYAVDHHMGSSGEPFNHGSATMNEGNYSLMTWMTNMSDHWQSGRAKPIRMHSKQAAEMFQRLGIKIDMCFIDGDHSRPGITADIETWQPLMSEGGLLCGHDYSEDQPEWVEVRQVVDEKLPMAQLAPHTSIWHTTAHYTPQVFDTFIFFNELDVLDIRFAELDSVVDRWIIAEGTLTHSGQSKPLYFDQNKERYAKYLHKITHIVVDDYPALPDPKGDLQVAAENAWTRERWQRDAIMRGLGGCKDNDIIILGDADEIARADTVRAYDPSQGLVRFKQRLFYYQLNCENKDGWDWLKIAPYRMVKELTPCGLRYPPAGNVPLVENGGWHFSFLSPDADGIVQKLKSYAHVEYATPEFMNIDSITRKMELGEDLFGR